MRRDEFWASDPVELWWLVESKKEPPKYAGGMTEEQVRQIWEEDYGQ
jgi:hypothetical protein